LLTSLAVVRVSYRSQTMAFSWVSNVQLVSGAFVSLVAGILSDIVGISFPFVFTGVLTIAVFLYYATRAPGFFGPDGHKSPAAPVTHEGTV
jgi:fucose permease